MNFGPAEMAQMMDAAKAFIAVTMVYSVGIGIVLGALYHIFFRHHAGDQSFRSGMPNVPALPPVPAAPPTVPIQEIDATAPHSPRSPAPRANNLLRACTH